MAIGHPEAQTTFNSFVMVQQVSESLASRCTTKVLRFIISWVAPILEEETSLRMMAPAASQFTVSISTTKIRLWD